MPPPTTVTYLPLMVATNGLELVYVKVPGRLAEGSTNKNEASPYVFVLFAPRVKFVKMVVNLFTVRVV